MGETGEPTASRVYPALEAGGVVSFSPNPTANLVGHSEGPDTDRRPDNQFSGRFLHPQPGPLGFGRVCIARWAVIPSPRHTEGGRRELPACSAMLQKRLEQMGFTFYLGVVSKEILGSDQVKGLLLEDGRTIETELIIISAGVRPNLELGQKLGLKIGKAIPVSDRMETEIPNIYAAGDGIEHKGMVYGIWPASEKQGQVAGLNMAGQTAEYTGTTPSNQLKVAGIDLLAAGDIDPEGKLLAFVDQNQEAGTYRKLVLKDNRLVGCLLFGTLEGRKKILKAMDEQKDLSAIKATGPV